MLTELSVSTTIRKDIYKVSLTSDLKEKIIELKIMADRKIPFDDHILDEVGHFHPKQLERICKTNYKYICVSRIGNQLTYYVAITRKNFKWYSTFSDIREAVKAIKVKFREHKMPCKSIKIY